LLKPSLLLLPELLLVRMEDLLFLSALTGADTCFLNSGLLLWMIWCSAVNKSFSSRALTSSLNFISFILRRLSSSRLETDFD